MSAGSVTVTIDPPRRRRSGLRRAAKAVALTLTGALVLGIVGVVGWVKSGATILRVTDVQRAGHEWTPGAPLFVLLLGDDLRAGAGCGCTDAIHLVGIPAGGGKATMLDIPRDTRVNIPGRGNRKINEAFQKGARMAADVVGALVGVSISYVVDVGFDDFPQLVDELGGVQVDIPTSINDKNAGAAFDQGTQVMDGTQALAFSRSRHIPGGDFARTEHQGLFIISMLARVRQDTATPLDTMRKLAVMYRHTETEGMSTADLYRLARVALAIDPAEVRNVVMPGRAASISGTSYVVTTSAAGPLFADFADDALLSS